MKRIAGNILALAGVLVGVGGLLFAGLAGAMNWVFGSEHSGMLGLFGPLLIVAFIGYLIWTNLGSILNFFFNLCSPLPPSFAGLDQCEKKNDVESRLICMSKSIEAAIKRKEGVEGKGLHEVLDSAKVAGVMVSEGDEKVFRRLASVRNNAVHNEDFDPHSVNTSKLLEEVRAAMDNLTRGNPELLPKQPRHRTNLLRTGAQVIGVLSLGFISLVIIFAGGGSS